MGRIMQQGECGENIISHQQASQGTPAVPDINLSGLGFREKLQESAPGWTAGKGVCRQHIGWAGAWCQSLSLPVHPF